MSIAKFRMVAIALAPAHRRVDPLAPAGHAMSLVVHNGRDAPDAGGFRRQHAIRIGGDGIARGA
ncbi:hypothetical protein C357_18080 [Citreicella sp. 357]|nr:hypothetical protein C357_18080 [Citreicella sp. 357]